MASLASPCFLVYAKGASLTSQDRSANESNSCPMSSYIGKPAHLAAWKPSNIFTTRETVHASVPARVTHAGGNLSPKAVRGFEGTAAEEEATSLQGSAQATVPRNLPVRPLPAPQKVSDESDASTSGGDPIAGLDRIEMQAKSSLQRLKHILYKLKTRPENSGLVVADPPMSAAWGGGNVGGSTILREDDRQVYVSQKIEVDLSTPYPTASEQELAEETASEGEEEAVSEESSSSGRENEFKMFTSEVVNSLESSSDANSGNGATETMSLTPVPLSAPIPYDDAAPSMPSTLSEFSQLDSLISTRTTVQFDEATQTAIVTVTATVRAAGDLLLDQSSCTERSIALATRALTRTCLALDEKSQVTAGGLQLGGPMVEVLAGRQKEHDEILRQLATSRVIQHTAVPEGEWGSSPFRPVYSVMLLTSEGQVVEAIFKPATPGDAMCRWERAPAEWVAYQVSALLGLDMVPPAVIRRDVMLGERSYTNGVMVYRVGDVRPLSSLHPEAWGPASPSTVLSSAHILDALLGSAARRESGFHAGRHWAAGRQVGSQGEDGKGELRPVLLEHPMGAGRKGEMHAMWSQRGRGGNSTGVQVETVSPAVLARLRGLGRGVLLEALSGALTQDEMDLLLERRDQVVAYLDAMASRRVGDRQVAAAQ
eukprot:TRINITY_DN11614_c0_g1_i1.p1 TRINITY_DN11614_c0_g1~~TRINITY_DN11614_c0_g1_i1.p1  ORF type:complete len:655 (-),score=105.84 TRINITY_DN11614_c0_g1_i1:2372-4336(-)